MKLIILNYLSHGPRVMDFHLKKKLMNIFLLKYFPFSNKVLIEPYTVLVVIQEAALVESVQILYYEFYRVLSLIRIKH